MDVLRSHPCIEQGSLRCIHHRRGPAHEGLIDRRIGQHAGQQVIASQCVEPPGKQLDRLRFARQHMDQAQPLHPAIFHRFERFQKQDRGHAPVAIDQAEARMRFGFQDRCDERQDRRDARATRKADHMPNPTRIGFGTETAIGRHHVDRTACTQVLVRPVRKPPAGHALDRDPQFAGARVVRLARADRIRAPKFFTVEHFAQRQELTCPKLVGRPQVRRDVEGDRDRITRLGAHLPDAQSIEVRNGHGAAGVGSLSKA